VGAGDNGMSRSRCSERVRLSPVCSMVTLAVAGGEVEALDLGAGEDVEGSGVESCIVLELEVSMLPFVMRM